MRKQSRSMTLRASNIAKELELEKHIIQIPLDNIVVSDAFEDFDKNIISWIIAKLEMECWMKKSVE